MEPDIVVVFHRRDGEGETHVDSRPFATFKATALCGEVELVSACRWTYLLPETDLCKACARLLEEKL
ncbi:hypothetical protein HQ590_07150 [bacterium]|nr:hypothetical protein [bacterium]